MTVRSLTLYNFRNFNEVTVPFSGRFTFIRGENGAGKTNLLESLYCLGRCRSFRKAGFPDMVRHNEQYFRLEANVGSDQLYFFFDRDAGAAHGLGEKKLPAKEYVGRIAPFAVTRELFNLIYYSPAEMRLHIDQLMASFDPDYYMAALKFRKVLDERNAVLRQRPVSTVDLDVWDGFYRDFARTVTEKRQAFTIALNEEMAVMYRRLFTDVHAELVYTPSFSDERFEQSRGSDIERGTSTLGPHRDRYEPRINGKTCITSASQGQAKSFVIALTATVLTMYRKKGGENGIILLDDVFEELDSGRKDLVFGVFNDFAMQTFITGTEPFGTRIAGSKELICAGGSINEV